MARPAKSDKLKVIQGTFRPDRARSHAEPVGDTPVPFFKLSAESQAAWDRITAELEAIGVCSATFEIMISLAACVLGEIAKLSNFCRENGHTYNTTTTAGDIVPKRRPESVMLNRARSHAQSLLHDLGLSPKGIKNLEAPPIAPKNSGWVKLTNK